MPSGWALLGQRAARAAGRQVLGVPRLVAEPKLKPVSVACCDRFGQALATRERRAVAAWCRRADAGGCDG